MTSNTTSNTPPFVEPDMDNGCETGACELAKLFYTRNERVVRRLRFRRELSDFYLATFNAWAPSEVITNPALHRTFSQVLYALVNDGKVLCVVIPVFFGSTILLPIPVTNHVTNTIPPTPQKYSQTFLLNITVLPILQAISSPCQGKSY